MPAIDYTSRDYASLREELISVIKERIPDWNSGDPSDVGLALVEAFAYLGDVTSYYTDRVVNEAYLSTATQRQSVIDIARMLGYTPATSMPAIIGSLTIYNPGSTPTTVYTGTQFTGNVVDGGVQKQVVFEVQLDSAAISWSSIKSVDVPSNGSITVRAVQGSTAFQQTLGVSDGSSDQEFVIPTGSLIEGSLYVASGTIGGYDGANANADPLYGYARYGNTAWDNGPIIYARTTGLAALLPSQNAYSLIVDADSVRLRFGDGVNGRIPPKDHTIYATYRTGGGRFGNVPAGTRLTGPANLYGISNSDAFGGTEPESNASIRKNAPATFRSRNRAVTKRDFSDIALTYPGVAKAQARANNATSVTLYVSPQSSSGYAAPGYYVASVLARYRTSTINTLVLSSIPAGIITATAASGTSSTTTRTVTTTAAHGFTAGQTVTVYFGDSNYDGSFTIASVPSTTTFTYSASTSTSSAATLTTKYLTQGTMSVSGLGDGYDKSNTPFTLITSDSANPDPSTGVGRPTVRYSAGISTTTTGITTSGTLGTGSTATPATGTATFQTGTSPVVATTPLNFPQVGEKVTIGGSVAATVTSISTNSFTFSYTSSSLTASTSSTVASAADGNSGTNAVASAGVVISGEDTDFEALRGKVEAFLEERSSAGTNVTVSGPLYEDVMITATIYVESTVAQSAAIKAAKDTILSIFDYENIEMGAVVRKQSIAGELSKLAEIGYATVDLLSLSGGNDTDMISSGTGGVLRLLSGLRSGTSAFTASQGSGYAKDTYTEGNMVIKIGGSTGIADLGTA